MNTKVENPCRLITVEFRLSFPNLPPAPPRKDEDTGRETYGIGMLFPPGTDKTPFMDALRHAMIVKHGSDVKKWPRLKMGPDQVLKDFEEYNANSKTPLPGDWENWILVRANSRVSETSRPPGVVGPTRGPDGMFERISDLREIYGGRWAKASIDAYYYNIKGKNNGVTFGLSNVQLLKHDSRFGAMRPPAEDDFEDASDEWAGKGDAFETRGKTDTKTETKTNAKAKPSKKEEEESAGW
jgi:hypothetical protein